MSTEQRTRTGLALAGLLLFLRMVRPVARGGALRFDAPVRAAVHGWSWPALTAAMRGVTMLGSEYFLVPLAAILVWWWLRGGNRRAAGLLLAASLSAEAVLQLLKALILRPRPEMFFGLAPAETYSFPSGHAFVPAVFFWIVAGTLPRPARWRAAVVVMAIVLGFSRVYLGYHYPSDVVAGWALAAVWISLSAGIRTG